ncbi:MAG: porin family protein [Bacteroidota bacterium]
MMPVKNIYLCILFIGLSITSVFAQIKKEESDPLGYGLKLGINYSMNGTQYSDWSGLAGVNLGMFFTKPISNRVSWFVEPAFSTVSFRERETDTRYINNYIDANAFLYYYPSSINTDFAFIGGIKPSYLIAYSSEVFETGSYNTKDLAINRNKKGQLDAGLMLGMAISLSPVINLEVIYNQGLTSNNSPAKVEGRSSTVEVNLRLNAVALRKSLDGKNQSTEELVQHLHKGVLLVMLPTTNEKEINRLRAERKTDEIEMLEADLRIRNNKVIREFNKNFSFCPVYYFMDTSIYKVLSGNIKGIFVNYNLQVDTTIEVNTDNFFIASFCEDVSEYTKRKHFGLFVYDKQMIQMEKPFNAPNQLANPVFDYVVVKAAENKTRKPSYTTVPFDRLVSKFNTRLFRYIN